MAKHNKFFGYYTTLAIVVANMVGTGVFTTLGLQAIDIQSGFALNVFTLLTVLGVIVLRFTSPGFRRPYRL